jgi:hypothetical protein
MGISFRRTNVPKFTVETFFTAKVEGKYKVTVDADSAGEAKELAEEQARQDIEEELGNCHQVETDNCEVTIDDMEICRCKTCKGRTYLISTLEEGAGLLKVGPCPECQLIPNTSLVCQHVLALLQKVQTDSED